MKDIRRASADDADAIGAFRASSHSDGPFAEDFADPVANTRNWRWANLENPLRPGGDPLAWLCVEDRRIVGYAGGLAVILARADGRTTSAAWLRDLIVAKDARPGRLAILLIARAVTDAGLLLLGGMNPAVRKVYRGLGYLDLGDIPLMLRVNRSRAFANAIDYHGLRATVVANLIPLTQLFARRPRTRARPIATPSQEIDDRFDAWWPQVEQALGLAVRRSRETLTWRYLKHPTHRYEVLRVADTRGLRGLAVTRHGSSRGMPAGFIVELLAHPADSAAIDALIERCLDTLGQRDGDIFVRCSVRGPRFERRLRAAGFLNAPSPTGFMVAGTDRTVLAELQRSEWFLNGGDSDLDFI